MTSEGGTIQTENHPALNSARADSSGAPAKFSFFALSSALCRTQPVFHVDPHHEGAAHAGA
jgi:hypothetical protein